MKINEIKIDNWSYGTGAGIAIFTRSKILKAISIFGLDQINKLECFIYENDYLKILAHGHEPVPLKKYNIIKYPEIITGSFYNILKNSNEDVKYYIGYVVHDDGRYIEVISKFEE